MKTTLNSLPTAVTNKCRIGQRTSSHRFSNSLTVPECGDLATGLTENIQKIWAIIPSWESAGMKRTHTPLWAGKALPSCMQWQRAGDWPGDTNGSKYPWGNGFDPTRVNLWNDKSNGTVPVADFVEGTTPNGVYQLIGNVWEWVATLFECTDGPEGTRVVFEQPMAEIRGGAFDTYFSSQATCRFRTGQPLMLRSKNIGFRCCAAIESLGLPSDPYAFLEEDEVQ